MLRCCRGEYWRLLDNCCSERYLGSISHLPHLYPTPYSAVDQPIPSYNVKLWLCPGGWVNWSAKGRDRSPNFSSSSRLTSSLSFFKWIIRTSHDNKGSYDCFGKKIKDFFCNKLARKLIIEIHLWLLVEFKRHWQLELVWIKRRWVVTTSKSVFTGPGAGWW